MQSQEDIIKREFLMEASELLEECESLFLTLEKDPLNSETLDRIFRLAHTIKGSGYAAGFDDLAGFAHLFEALLDKLRKRAVDPSRPLIDLMLQSNDHLRSSVQALLADDATSVRDEILERRIREMLHDGDESGVEPGKPEADSVGFGLFEDEDVVAESKSVFDKVATLVPRGRLLVVDDEKEHLELVRRALESLEIDIECTDSPSEALRLSQAGDFDLLMADLKMPEMSGSELARRIRVSQPTLPFIFCSGFAERGDLAEFIELGAVGFIDKPYDVDYLRLVVSRALQFKMTRDVVLHLAKKSFQSYRVVSRMMMEARLQSKSADALREVESILDDISKLSHFILAPSPGGLKIKKVA